MGTLRFIPEFKEEAIRQITERGYSVSKVSERLGVLPISVSGRAGCIWRAIDLFDRNVVGWLMKPTLPRELALDALKMLYGDANPQGRSSNSQIYGSDDWLRLCWANNLAPSISRRGNCRDNAVAESFLSSLKKERNRKSIYKTWDLARADIFDYI